MTLRTRKFILSGDRPPSFAWHRSHLHQARLKRVWGKSPRRRTGRKAKCRNNRIGEVTWEHGNVPWARRSRSNLPRKRATSASDPPVKSRGHLTGLAAKRGKRRTDDMLKRRVGKGGYLPLCWMAWMIG